MTLAVDIAQLLAVCAIAVYCYLDRRDGNRYRNDARELLGDRVDAVLAGVLLTDTGRQAVVAALRNEEQANGHREHEDFSHDLMMRVGSDR